MIGWVFERVQDFRYLGAVINLKKLINDAVKSRISAGNNNIY